MEERVLLAVSASWTGAVSTSWNDPNNWNPAAVPKATGDTATFGDQKITNNAVVDVTGGVTLDQLTITAGFANNSITVSGANTLSVGKTNTTSSMAAGSIVLNNGGQFLVFRSAVFNWTGGTFGMIDNSSTVEVALGTFNISGTASSMQANLRVDATGTVSLTSSNDVTMGHLVAPPGPSYSSNVSNAGAINVGVDHGFLSYNTSAPGTFTNSGTGTFTKSAGTGTTTVGLQFSNSGTFKIQSGTVSFTSTASQTTGTTTLFNNTTLAVAGEYNVSGGVFQGNGATTTVRGNLTVTGGKVYPGGDGLVGTLNVTNNFSISSFGTLYIDNDIGNKKNDQVAVTNQFSVGGTLTVNTLNGTPPDSAIYTIIPYGSLMGTDFDTLNLNYTGGFYTSIPKGTGPSYQIQASMNTGGSSPVRPALSSSSSRHVTAPMSLGPASLARLLGPGTSGALPVGADSQGLVTGWGSQTGAGLWWLPFPSQPDDRSQAAADTYFLNLSAALDASLLAFDPAAT